jgi:hypothetical protein
MSLEEVEERYLNQSEFNIAPFLLEKEPNQEMYYDVLRKMNPEQKIAKVIELTELSRELMKEGLKIQFPNKTGTEIHQLYLDRLKQCHNSNY